MLCVPEMALGPLQPLAEFIRHSIPISTRDHSSPIVDGGPFQRRADLEPPQPFPVSVFTHPVGGTQVQVDLQSPLTTPPFFRIEDSPDLPRRILVRSYIPFTGERLLGNTSGG